MSLSFLKKFIEKIDKVTFKIQNIVASSKPVTNYIYLNKFFKENFENCKYNPKSFPGLSYRIPKLKTTLLLFKSAKINCTGAKNLESIQKSYEKIYEVLSKDYSMHKLEYKIQNMVVVADFKQKIDLYELYYLLEEENVDYDPEQFPGVIYKFDNSTTFLIFYSGKIVLTGAKSTESISQVVKAFGKKLINLLRKNSSF